MRARRRSALVACALLVGVFGSGVGQVALADRATGEPIVAERAAVWGVSVAWLVRVAECETGRTWNPTVVGRQGERGPFQLHPRGLLPHFYALGYHDPEDWWEASDFAARMFAAGLASHWSCA